MAISKRLRYEVLRRDDHTCRYCGAKAPDVEITVDHVVPKALGGSDDPSNLVAACRDCNSGKTSSTPDAPLLADVADKALEWAQAMRQAQAQMLADVEARSRNRDQFLESWNSWTREIGSGREPLPMDPGWQFTVDQLTAAGLPVAVLGECIDIAMTRTTRPGRRGIDHQNVFRYMCGVAWNKVTELQEAARKVGSTPDSSPGTAPDPYVLGQLNIATRLLALMTDEEQAAALDSADDRDWCRDQGEPVQTGDEVVMSAALQAFEHCRIDLDRLVGQVVEALKKIPGGIGRDAMRDARKLLFSGYGAGFSHKMFLGVALANLEDESAYPEAAAYLGAMPDEVGAEWIALTREAYRGILMTDKGIAVRAAERARHGQRIRQDWDKCAGPGEHTPVCLEAPAYLVRIAELECCEQGSHKGHRICERHLAQLVDGTLRTPDGATLSASDFTEYDPSEDPWAA